jgi:ribosomal protein S12
VIILKQAIRTTVTILIALCFAVPVMGAGQEMSKPNINLFAGEVKTISVKEKTIFLKNDKAEMTIVCNEKTVFRSGKSKVTFDDIKKGDMAAVIYDVVDGSNVAKSISFQSLKASPATEQKAKP